MNKTIQTRIVKNGHGDYWVRYLDNNSWSNHWRDVTDWKNESPLTRKSQEAAETVRRAFIEKERKNKFKTVETFVDTL